jgi:aconitate decarboxylase
MSTPSLLDRWMAHAQSARLCALPREAVDAAVSFITDSVAVGLAGSRHARLPQVFSAAAAWGQGQAARDWASGSWHPAATAALLNAYQIHNQEFDCVHERAVVHPLATVLPALVAQAERSTSPISGQALIEALVLAVDVAITLGSAQVAPMRFFRPAMCGQLGAVMGLARLANFSAAQTAEALGIAYSTLAGTMQAHLEGSPMLAMQVGMAARAAVTAIDLAAAGFAGPKNVIDGPFGYFNLFDAELAPRAAAVHAVFDELQTVHRITEVSHKPWPSGRASHGALDGLSRIVSAQGLKAEHITRIELAAPPLILRLIGRPWQPAMDVNYARLCLPYLAATLLLKGQLGLQDFERDALDDPARARLAHCVFTGPNDCLDPNALTPQTLTVQTTSGARHRVELPAVLGAPGRPLSAAQQRAKFEHCCTHAGMPAAAIGTLHAACLQLPDTPDIRTWVNLMKVR